MSGSNNNNNNARTKKEEEDETEEVEDLENGVNHHDHNHNRSHKNVDKHGSLIADPSLDTFATTTTTSSFMSGGFGGGIGGNDATMKVPSAATAVAESAVIANGPMDVLCSKFAIMQFVFNIIASFIGPLGTFYLLFGYLSEGPYDWSSGALVGVVVGSIGGSPILIFALLPVALPEAVQKGWFPRIALNKIFSGCQQEQGDNNNDSSSSSSSSWISSLLLYILSWRWSTARNLALTIVFVGTIYVPIFLLLARYAIGPTLSTWQLIWFNVIYEILLAIPVVALGLLGYAIDDNLDATIARMSQNPNLCSRTTLRVLSSLKMTIWP